MGIKAFRGGVLGHYRSTLDNNDCNIIATPSPERWSILACKANNVWHLDACRLQETTRMPTGNLRTLPRLGKTLPLRAQCERYSHCVSNDYIRLRRVTIRCPQSSAILRAHVNHMTHAGGHSRRILASPSYSRSKPEQKMQDQSSRNFSAVAVCKTNSPIILRMTIITRTLSRKLSRFPKHMRREQGFVRQKRTAMCQRRFPRTALA